MESQALWGMNQGKTIYLETLILTPVDVLFILRLFGAHKRGIFGPGWEGDPGVIQNLWGRQEETSFPQLQNRNRTFKKNQHLEEAKDKEMRILAGSLECQAQFSQTWSLNSRAAGRKACSCTPRDTSETAISSRFGAGAAADRRLVGKGFLGLSPPPVNALNQHNYKPAFSKSPAHSSPKYYPQHQGRNRTSQDCSHFDQKTITTH